MVSREKLGKITDHGLQNIQYLRFLIFNFKQAANGEKD
jgi:hypothetical protein